jgi:hypothetical protein
MVGLTSALRAPAVSAIVAVIGRSNAQSAMSRHSSVEPNLLYWRLHITHYPSATWTAHHTVGY